MSTSRDTGHLDLELQDLLDDRAAPDVRAAAEAHLRGCVGCRRRLAVLDATRSAARAVVEPPEPAPELAARLAVALDDEDARAPRRSGVRRWAIAATALAAVLVAAVLLRQGQVPNVVEVATADFRTHGTTLPSNALRTGDVGELERFLGAAKLPFPVRVLDLGMMGWKLVGGWSETFADRPSLVLVYQRDGRTVICRMYQGTTSALPAGARVEDHRGFRFHVYERDGVTAVFWQEGPTVCVLIGDGAARDIVDLAIEKAMAPA